MGELLDSLDRLDSGSGALDEPMSSVIDEATESFIGRDGAAVHQRRTAVEVMSGWVRQGAAAIAGGRVPARCRVFPTPSISPVSALTPSYESVSNPAGDGIRI